MKINDLDLNEEDKDYDISQTYIGAKALAPDEKVNAMMAARGLILAAQGEVLSGPQRKALKGYVDAFVTMITNPSMRPRLKAMQKIAKKVNPVDIADGENDSKKDKE